MERIKPKLWDLDDDNLEEMAGHGLDEETFFQVCWEAPRFRRNKKDRAGTYQMVGPDKGGRFWIVVILEIDHDDGVWRPITAWTADAADREWYERSGGAYAETAEETDVAKGGA